MNNHSIPIQFHNTLSGKTEPFVPLREGEVGMYTCGPTVYDYAHIGNFRAFVFEDLLRRLLEFHGYKVKHVMNITDVDDKTIARAKAEGLDHETYAKAYTARFFEDWEALNLLKPSECPKATDETEIAGMIKLINRLVSKGLAYEKDGSFYFRPSKFEGYGKLSKKKLEMNVEGASHRVDDDNYEKEEARDFALWKAAKEGEPSWESPGGEGRGRPGWHIECSAMSMRHLDETFDIHAGGEDLVFPHHENEIAQSEGATGKPFVRYWLHCRFLLVNGEKMSKSKGNFYLLHDLREQPDVDPIAIRYILLATHYRTPLNFTLDGLKNATEVIKRLDDCYWNCLNRLGALGLKQKFSVVSGASIDARLSDLRNEIVKALSDDLNVSVAIASLLEAVTVLNKAVSEENTNEANMRAAIDFFKDMDKLFGLNIVEQSKVPDDVADAFSERESIRFNPEFKKDKDLQSRSDKLRDFIVSNGWFTKDGKLGVQPSILQKKRRAWDK